MVWWKNRGQLRVQEDESQLLGSMSWTPELSFAFCSSLLIHTYLETTSFQIYDGNGLESLCFPWSHIQYPEPGNKACHPILQRSQQIFYDFLIPRYDPSFCSLLLHYIFLLLNINCSFRSSFTSNRNYIQWGWECSGNYQLFMRPSLIS